MKTSLLIGGLPLILLILTLGTLFPGDAFCATDAETVHVRTEDDIRNTWNGMKPLFSGSPFDSIPVSGYPFAPGLLSRGFAEDGIRVTNFVRYLAYLPPNVVVDANLMEQAQYGAILLSSTDEFSHEPSKPALMPEGIYRKGLASTSTSNIARGFFSVESAIRYGYVRDDDEYNLRTLGHRRWILNPRFGKTGFGYAEALHYGMKKPIGDSTMQVHDFSAPEIDYEYIAWPSPGYFPREFFDSDDPWSITLNPEKYRAPDIDSVSVTIVRTRDGKRWTMNESGFESADSKEFFHVNLEYYAVPDAVIFPPLVSEIEGQGISPVTGDRNIEAGEFQVEVSGLVRADGTKAFLTYPVTFFDLEPGTKGNGGTERAVASR